MRRRELAEHEFELGVGGGSVYLWVWSASGRRRRDGAMRTSARLGTSERAGACGCESSTQYETLAASSSGVNGFDCDAGREALVEASGSVLSCSEGARRRWKGRTGWDGTG